MARRPSKQGISTGILVVLLAGVLVSQALQAGATHQPADKAVGSSEEITEVPKVPPGPSTGAGTEANTILGPVTIRSSKPSDLMLQVTLECSILTEVTSSTGQLASTAEGEIRVWIVIDETTIVPISSVSSPPQEPSENGSDIDKVTFCNRAHELEQMDAENEQGEVDTTRSFIETKEANAFNWVYLNVGSGLHTIEVRADFEATTDGTATASGYVGNRMLLVEPTKMANDVTI